MDLPTFQSGLHAAWADARQFLAAVRFARPGLLVAVARAGRRVARRLGRRPAAAGADARAWPAGGGRRVEHHAPADQPARRTSRSCSAGGRSCSGSPGRGGGRAKARASRSGRDVVARARPEPEHVGRRTWRSPAAPERWQAAVAGAVDLVDALQRAGGHRVAVVVFAARPRVVVPLTTDYDHVRQIAELDRAAARPRKSARPTTWPRPARGSGPPSRPRSRPTTRGSPATRTSSLSPTPTTRPTTASGSRRVTAARTANIPVHVVGVGDPDQDSFVFRGDSPAGDGRPRAACRPRCRRGCAEAVAKAIADEARGAYLPAQRQVPRLGEFFRTTDRAEPVPRTVRRPVAAAAGPVDRVSGRGRGVVTLRLAAGAVERD